MESLFRNEYQVLDSEDVAGSDWAIHFFRYNQVHPTETRVDS